MRLSLFSLSLYHVRETIRGESFGLESAAERPAQGQDQSERYRSGKDRD